MANVIIFGDSITWGAFDEEKGGWVERLKLSVPLQESHVYNCGVSGETTKDLLKRFDVEIASRNRKNTLIIFAIGINDSRFLISKNSHKTSLDDFDKNILLLYSKAKEYTKNIIFIGLTKVDEIKTIPRSLDSDIIFRNNVIQEYDSIIQKICKNNTIKYIPMFDLLETDDLCDGLHPNATGHNKMFKRVEEYLRNENIF